ncbi:MAG TPA: glycosyltransferase [Candidatus Limnocylindrales bacterium]|nr:glycosyltransferase [Candidatus Limnocylindrales bacterium]
MTSSERRAPRAWILTSVHGPRDPRIFHRQARSLAAAGYAVTILAPGARPGREAGIAFSGLPARGGRATRPLRWPILLWRAARARADIYHIHDPELLPWAVLLQRLTGRPVIYDSHEFFAESLRSKLWLPALLREPLARLAEPLEKALAARLGAVVAVTPEMADRFVARQPRTVVVMNLPPRAADPPPAARAPVVVYAGLMNRERGLDILRATAARVRRDHPDFELRVLGPVEWYGLPDERALRPEVWAAAGVRFLGTVPPEEVAGHLQAAAIGWLPMNPAIPSKRLAWPIKLGEYLAAGLPVVASDLPVQARVLREAGAGTIVAPFTAEAHAAAIAALLDDPAEARRLGEAGRAYAAAQLTWESQAAVLVGLYRLLLGSRIEAR